MTDAAWRTKANCLGIPPAEFLGKHPSWRAIGACAGCRVWANCLIDDLETCTEAVAIVGYRAALTEQERRVAWRQRQRQLARV